MSWSTILTPSNSGYCRKDWKPIPTQTTSLGDGSILTLKTVSNSRSRVTRDPGCPVVALIMFHREVSRSRIDFPSHAACACSGLLFGRNCDKFGKISRNWPGQGTCDLCHLRPRHRSQDVATCSRTREAEVRRFRERDCAQVARHIWRWTSPVAQRQRRTMTLDAGHIPSSSKFEFNGTLSVLQATATAPEGHNG